MPISQDASGRLRVGQLTTLSDLKCIGTDKTLLIENAGTGSGVYGDSKYVMSVAAGEYRIRQGRRINPYFSGKSQMLEFTSIGFNPEVGVVKRIGMFSSGTDAPYNTALDGVFLESAGNGPVSLNIYNNGTRVHYVPMPNMNGAQVNINFENFNVFLIDWLWLGGAILRLFIKTDSGFELLHTVNHAGNQADIFMLQPNHPIRYEIRSTTGTGSLTYVCAQVSTEGAIDAAGSQYAIDSGSTAISCATIGTTYPIIGIRKSSANLKNALRLINFNAFVSSNSDQTIISLLYNPTIEGGTPTWSAITGHAAEYSLGNGTLTATAYQDKLFSVPLSQNNIVPSNLLEEDFSTWIGQTLAGASDVIWLCSTPITTTVGTFAGLVLKDY